MKKTTLLTAALLIVFSLSTSLLRGQTVNRTSSSFGSNWQVNLQLGITQFYGDAASNGFFEKFSGESPIGVNLTGRKHFSPVFGLGLEFYYTGIKSVKKKSADGTPVDFELRGKYLDLNLQAYLDFTNLLWGYNASRKISVYGMLGVGYATWNTTLDDHISGNSISSGVTINNDTYKRNGMVIPVGFGINYRISPHWSVNTAGNFRTILNDDLDVWRGGFEYDQLFYASIGVSYHINPLFGASKKSKRSKEPKTKRTVTEKEPVSRGADTKAHIPLFDYTKNASKPSSGGGSSKKIEVQDMDQPTQAAPVRITGIEYRVQILAKRDRLSSVNILRSRYKLSSDIYENFQDGVYRYSSGSFNSYSAALQHSQRLKAKGISDAFVVVYKDNKRIPLTKELKR